MNAKTLLCATALFVAGTGYATAGNNRPVLGDGAHDTIVAMANASTWGHPDQYGQFSGLQNYARGDYKNALKYFKYGAKYADKFSQLSIGLMYLNGKGVAKDPAMAWAWIDIAAERDYPQFVATRDRVWEQLTPQQRDQAKADKKHLYAEYGDTVAKPRMTHVLQYWRTQMTGSRVGFNSGVKHMDKEMLPGGTHTPNSNCMGKGIEGAPIAGCGGDIYAKWRWEPKLYFQDRDAQWKGTVSVGDLKQVDAVKPPAPTPSDASN